MNDKLQQIKLTWLEDYANGVSESTDLALKEAYQLGRDAQRESDASLFLIHGDYTSSRIVYAIKNNTGEL